MTDLQTDQRDRAVYADYLKSLEYRQKIMCEKYQISLSRFKQIVLEQKLKHRMPTCEGRSLLVSTANNAATAQGLRRT